MGADIHVRISVYNRNTAKWEWARLYNKKGDIIKPYFGRDYELFNLLQEDVPYRAIGSILPKEFDKDLANEYYKCFPISREYTGYFGARIINFADLFIYAKDHPKSKDEPDEVSPLIGFINTIHFYVKFFDNYYDLCLNNSDIAVTYWFDN